MSNLIIEVVRDDGVGEENPVFTADGKRWRVLVGGLENFGGVSYEVSTQPYAQYDGSLVKRERTPEQDRTMVFVALFDPEEARDEAMSFFIPRREYTVRCTAFGRTRHFKGRQYAFDVELGGVYEPTRATWTCLSSQPFWLSEEEHSYDIARADGRRGFPFISWVDRVSPVSVARISDGEEKHVKGFVVGTISHITSLTNGGHTPCYPKFTVTASDEVVNPEIKVIDSAGNTAMDVTVLVTMQTYDELIIDFESLPTEITLNGENVSHLVKPGSTLAASIGVGRYDVEWSADSGDAALHVIPSIRERFTGI